MAIVETRLDQEIDVAKSAAMAKVTAQQSLLLFRQALEAAIDRNTKEKREAKKLTEHLRNERDQLQQQVDLASDEASLRQTASVDCYQAFLARIVNNQDTEMLLLVVYLQMQASTSSQKVANLERQLVNIRAESELAP